MRRLYRIRLDGVERIPSTGPVILAPNHRSFMDSIFLCAAAARPVFFVAKAEYFDHRLTRWIFTGTGQIPLRRGSPGAVLQAMADAERVLGRGGILGIYPEGTRSRDGLLHRGSLGPARLALATGAPIVPVGLIGTEAVQEVGRRAPRIGLEVTIRFGPPFFVSRPIPGVNQKAAIRDATVRLMDEIASLSGQQRAGRRVPAPALAGTHG